MHPPGSSQPLTSDPTGPQFGALTREPEGRSQACEAARYNRSISDQIPQPRRSQCLWMLVATTDDATRATPHVTKPILRPPALERKSLLRLFSATW